MKKIICYLSWSSREDCSADLCQKFPNYPIRPLITNTIEPEDLMHLSVSSKKKRGGRVGHRVGVLTFSKKIISNYPPPGKKKLSKLAETNGLLLFYYIKMKDQMHDVRSKSPPCGLPDPAPLGLDIDRCIIVISETIPNSEQDLVCCAIWRTMILIEPFIRPHK